MALQELTVENLEGGRALAVMNEQLRVICGDVVKRKFLGQKRKVVLTLEIQPKIEGGETNMPELEWQVTWSIPGRSGMQNRLMEQDGRLLTNPSEIGNPMQGSLHDVPGYTPDKPDVAE